MNALEKFREFQKKRLYSYMISFLIVYALAVLVMFQMQRSFIYFPGFTQLTPRDVGASGMEVISVQPADMSSTISGWYQPPADPQKPVIIYYHGNAMTIPQAFPRVKPFADAGYGVLLAEYRGYNGNPGKPKESGLYADADAYTKWLKTAAGIPESRLVFYGLSLGSGVAVEQALKNPDAAAVILEAPYTSLVDVARRSYFFLPVDFLMRDRYHSARRIGRMDIPLLILHGGRDRVVPVSHGKKLYALAREPKTIKIYPAATHIDLPEYGAISDALAFLNAL